MSANPGSFLVRCSLDMLCSLIAKLWQKLQRAIATWQGQPSYSALNYKDTTVGPSGCVNTSKELDKSKSKNSSNQGSSMTARRTESSTQPKRKYRRRLKVSSRITNVSRENYHPGY
jgi:hypothetical protein